MTICKRPNRSSKKRTMLRWLIAALIALPLLAQATCPNSRAEASDLRADVSLQQQLAPPSVPAIAPALPFAKTVQLGKQTYRRSCVSCHGIEPRGLYATAHSERFASAVLDGRGEMPALGFKLSALEVEQVQSYVRQCTSGVVDC